MLRFAVHPLPPLFLLLQSYDVSFSTYYTPLAERIAEKIGSATTFLVFQKVHGEKIVFLLICDARFTAGLRRLPLSLKISARDAEIPFPAAIS